VVRDEKPMYLAHISLGELSNEVARDCSTVDSARAERCWLWLLNSLDIQNVVPLLSFNNSCQLLAAMIETVLILFPAHRLTLSLAAADEVDSVISWAVSHRLCLSSVCYT